MPGRSWTSATSPTGRPGRPSASSSGPRRPRVASEIRPGQPGQRRRPGGGRRHRLPAGPGRDARAHRAARRRGHRGRSRGADAGPAAGRSRRCSRRRRCAVDARTVGPWPAYARGMGSDALILAIDQGTTNTKAILVDRRGDIRAQASRAMAIEYPRPGWVQQDASAIWQAVRDCVDECLAVPAPLPSPPSASPTSARPASPGMPPRASPSGPAVTWQCRRSAELCERLRAEGQGPRDRGADRAAGRPHVHRRQAALAPRRRS